MWVFTPFNLVFSRSSAVVTTLRLCGHVAFRLAHQDALILLKSSLQNCSNSATLQRHQVYTAFSKSSLKFSMALRSGFWLSYSKTFTLLWTISVQLWWYASGHCLTGKQISRVLICLISRPVVSYILVCLFYASPLCTFRGPVVEQHPQSILVM